MEGFQVDSMWLAWVQDLLLSLLEHLGLSLRRDCKVHVCTFLNGLRMPPLFSPLKGRPNLISMLQMNV